MLNLLCSRKGSIHFGPEVYSSQTLDDLPFVEIGSLSDEVFASYSGPDDGLAYALDNKENGKLLILNLLRSMEFSIKFDTVKSGWSNIT